MALSSVVSSHVFLALALSGVLLGSTGCSGDDGDQSNSDGTGGSGATGTGGSGNTLDGGATGGSGGGDEPAPTLPTAAGPCPEFTEGMVKFTAAGVSRDVQLYVDPAAAAASDGPLVFYWYGTGGQPPQAMQGLGTDGIARIKAAGGVVVAPVHINGGIFPWLQDQAQNYALMDEVIGCAQQKIGVDARRIHSLGFSAGALFTDQVSFEKSSYIASVVTYSGGGAGTPKDPTNLFPAMILFGGPNDMVVINFQTASHDFYDSLTNAGHFAFLCNHNGGHRIPTDAVSSAVQFLFDHPFGTTPDPYENGLPSGFPAYCAL